MDKKNKLTRPGKGKEILKQPSPDVNKIANKEVGSYYKMDTWENLFAIWHFVSISLILGKKASLTDLTRENRD